MHNRSHPNPDHIENFPVWNKPDCFLEISPNLSGPGYVHTNANRQDFRHLSNNYPIGTAYCTNGSESVKILTLIRNFSHKHLFRPILHVSGGQPENFRGSISSYPTEPPQTQGINPVMVTLRPPTRPSAAHLARSRHHPLKCHSFFLKDLFFSFKKKPVSTTSWNGSSYPPAHSQQWSRFME